MKKYRVLGLMSGTSLDGLDIAFCEFSFQRNRWQFCIVEAETIPYSASERKRLQQVENASALSFAETNNWFGKWMAAQVNVFLRKYKVDPHLISSHGHTVFHQPAQGVTVQLGSGASLAAGTGILTASDFRSTDVALGGQGAPLVPIGDQLLFSEKGACLNLGGFANISTLKRGKRVAYDICPVNIVLNDLCNRIHKPYDNKGQIARSGRLLDPLLKELNAAQFYTQRGPKSLGKEWVLKEMLPLLKRTKASVPDLLHTCTEHMAIQIGKQLKGNTKSVLITGGGAFNDFLVERIQFHSKAVISLPDYQLVNYKEALIFAFLGVLRLRNETNCLKSVTGASRNSVGGCLYQG
jgi:anhydro-N-acetylmuramic acid kinase